MTCIKICGMTHVDDVVMCAQAGADRLGFVVEYPVNVPWNLSREEAGLLMSAAAGRATRVAVVGGDLDAIGDILDVCHPEIVQLHGDETPQVVATIAARGDVRIIKVLRIPASTTTDRAGALAADAVRFVDAGADEILLDAVTDTRPAGTGIQIDWQLAAAIAAQVPVPIILAGGLRADNVHAALGAVHPWGVDVISGVECEGHRKSVDRVHAFVAAVRAADG